MERDSRSGEGIYALASGEGVSAVSVLRLSGRGTLGLLEVLCGERQRGGVHSFPPRKCVLRRLFHPHTGMLLDQALVVYFESGKSYTGEEMAELHLHGGLAVRRAVIGCLSEMEGWRPALAGEFTRRAFLGGRLDLQETEAILDLVNAETEEQRRQAVHQLSGDTGRGYRDWTDTVKMVLAHVEASLDFPEDADFDAFEGGGRDVIEKVCAEMKYHLGRAKYGERLHQGLLMVIAGEPNVGKSTFLNRLSEREAAIVTSQAGTTRDPVEVRLDWNGLPVTVVDTAGLREDAGDIEQMGIERALGFLERASVVVWIKEAGKRMKGRAWQRMVPQGTPMVELYNKIDMLREDKTSRHREGGRALSYDVSLKTGENWMYVKGELEKLLRGLVVGGDQALLVRERHKDGVMKARRSLLRALKAKDLVLVAEELRQAIRHLGTVTGKVTTEEILDVVFRDFCIGK